MKPRNRQHFFRTLVHANTPGDGGEPPSDPPGGGGGEDLVTTSSGLKIPRADYNSIANEARTEAFRSTKRSASNHFADLFSEEEAAEFKRMKADDYMSEIARRVRETSKATQDKPGSDDKILKFEADLQERDSALSEREKTISDLQARLKDERVLRAASGLNLDPDYEKSFLTEFRDRFTYDPDDSEFQIREKGENPVGFRNADGKPGSLADSIGYIRDKRSAFFAPTGKAGAGSKSRATGPKGSQETPGDGEKTSYDRV